MFAVLKTGGKQYRVQAGDVLRVEKLDAEAGDKVQFNDILMIGSTIGAPMVSGAGVVAEVIDTIKADKVITYHKRRRKHSSQRTRVVTRPSGRSLRRSSHSGYGESRPSFTRASW